MDVWRQIVDRIRNERFMETIKEGEMSRKGWAKCPGKVGRNVQERLGEMSRKCLSGTGMYIYM